MPTTRPIDVFRTLQAGLLSQNGPTDGEALQAFLSRQDESAFALLVRRHGEMVLRVCRRVLNNADDADDAFQATFLVLAKKAATIGQRDSLASWLYGVAYRVSLRVRRDIGRRRVHETQAAPMPRPDPADQLLWNDVQLLLEAEIDRLPEHYRSAFVLCYLCGRSRIEAAAELGIEENTLSSRLARARTRLQKQLDRRGVNLSAVLAAIALTSTSTSATVPPAMYGSISQAAVRFSAGQAVPGVSTTTIQLTHEAMRAMTHGKMKWILGTLAMGATLAIGTWSAGQVPGSKPTPGGAGGAPMAQEPPAKATGVLREANAEQRRRSQKNLKQLMVAMHNYHDTHGKFPSDVVGKDGKPLLSWRVQLLPFLEQDNLAKQIHFDEPWDSEHNLKFLSLMPEVFRLGFEPKDATHAYYQRFAFSTNWPAFEGSGNLARPAGGGGAAGPGAGGGPLGPMGGAGSSGGGALMPMGGAGGGPPGMPGGGIGGGAGPMASMPLVPRFPLQLAEISDGTSNTIGIVEAGPAVPWTKPADILYESKREIPKLSGPYTNVRNAVFLDGAFHCLKPSLDEKIMRMLIEPNDGNVIPSFASIHARFAADSDDERKILAKLMEQNQTLIAAIEKQIAERGELLALAGKITQEIERAEEEQVRLKAMLETLKKMNQQLREDLVGRRGSAQPRK